MPHGWIKHLRIFMTIRTQRGEIAKPDIVNVCPNNTGKNIGVRLIISTTSSGFADASQKLDKTFEGFEVSISTGSICFYHNVSRRDANRGSSIMLADAEHIAGSSKVNTRWRNIFIGSIQELNIPPTRSWRSIAGRVSLACGSSSPRPTTDGNVNLWASKLIWARRVWA